MAEESEPSESRTESSNLLLIVVGAHLRAETADRPLAYRLRERIHAWLEKHASGLNVPVRPVVCCDLWYMNHEELQGRPTISLGGPGVNALSHFFFQKLEANVLEGRGGGEQDKFIQLDREFIDLRVAIWGMDHDLTVDALELFNREYLD